jgi:hypothetical protein
MIKSFKAMACAFLMAGTTFCANAGTPLAGSTVYIQKHKAAEQKHQGIAALLESRAPELTAGFLDATDWMFDHAKPTKAEKQQGKDFIAALNASSGLTKKEKARVRGFVNRSIGVWSGGKIAGVTIGSAVGLMYLGLVIKAVMPKNPKSNQLQGGHSAPQSPAVLSQAKPSAIVMLGGLGRHYSGGAPLWSTPLHGGPFHIPAPARVGAGSGAGAGSGSMDQKLYCLGQDRLQPLTPAIASIKVTELACMNEARNTRYYLQANGSSSRLQAPWIFDTSGKLADEGNYYKFPEPTNLTQDIVPAIEKICGGNVVRIEYMRKIEGFLFSSDSYYLVLMENDDVYVLKSDLTEAFNARQFFNEFTQPSSKVGLYVGWSKNFLPLQSKAGAGVGAASQGDGGDEVLFVHKTNRFGVDVEETLTRENFTNSSVWCFDPGSPKDQIQTFLRQNKKLISQLEAIRYFVYDRYPALHPMARNKYGFFILCVVDGQLYAYTHNNKREYVQLTLYQASTLISAARLDDGISQPEHLIGKDVIASFARSKGIG